MMKRIAIFLLFAGVAYAQNWSPFLDPSRAIDWTSAGFTIPSYTVNCTTQPTLVAGSGNASANTTAIQTALASCDATHNVVNVPSGTYYVAGLTFGTQGKQVLRGAGANSTDLILTAEASCNGLSHGICMRASTFTYNGAPAVQPPSGSNQCAWSAGYTQGTTSITLSTCGGTPPANHMLILDQANDTSDTTGVYICDTATANCGYESDGSHDGRVISGVTHSQQQVVYATSVTSIGGGSYTVTITPGVYFTNVRSGQSPGAWWSGIEQNAGMENLTVDGTAIADGNMSMYDCYQCWIKGVRSIDAGRNHILIDQSMQDMIRDSYFYESQSHASESYGVEYQAASGTLVENNIFQQVTVPILLTASTGSVFDYNLGIDDVFSGGFLNGAYANHNAGNEMNLWEGNNFPALFADDAWGSSDQQTYYRNMLAGWQNGDTSSTIPILMRSYIRNFNAVGNVLGQPGYHTQYQAYATSTSGGTGGGSESHSIYSLGWGGTGASCSSPTCDPPVFSTLMRWGNWDTVNAATQWNTTEAAPAANTYVAANFTTSYFSSLAHTLPASLYYSSEPSWWTSGVAWPPIGPDVTGGTLGECSGGTYAGAQAVSSGQCTGGTLATAWASLANAIPAQSCYLNTMSGPPDGSGSVLSFNASTCYAAVAQAIAPTASIPTGTYNTTQVPVLTNTNTGTTVVCESTTATPATNGDGATCAVGTVIASGSTIAISAAATTTLKLVAGTSTLADSTVSSYTYAFSPVPWYVRADGGTRYSTNYTSGQCNGLYDAAYPGTGTNQNCAFNDARYLWQDGSHTFGSGYPSYGWVGTPGTSYVIRGSIADSVTYRVGWPTISNCGTAAPNYSGICGDQFHSGIPIPFSGTSGSPTRILGGNYGACTNQAARTQLHGGWGVLDTLNLTGASYVDVECLDITDFSNCGKDANYYACETGGVVNYDFASQGILFSNTSTNITMSNIRIHGMGADGILGAPGTGYVGTDVQIIGNADAGWNADPGDGTTGVGTFSLSNFNISWNGCVEEYPIVDSLPYFNCLDDVHGGYGDGFGTASVASASPGWQLTFNNGTASYNTQDGLDTLHVAGTGSTVTETRNLTYANGGQQIKAGGGAVATMQNNVIVGNCSALLQTIPGRPVPTEDNLGDTCRAGNTAVLIETIPGYPALVQDNTFYSGGLVALEIEYGTADTTSANVLKYDNNVFYGFYNSGGAQNPSPIYSTTSAYPNVLTNAGASWTNNSYYGWKSSWTCPNASETSALCTNPGLVDETYYLYGYGNMQPTSGSILLNAGIPVSGVTIDYLGVTRSISTPTIGAYENPYATPGTPIQLSGHIIVNKLVIN